MLLTDEGCCGVGGASQDSAGFGAMEEGLISREGRNLRLPLRFGLRPQGTCRVGKESQESSCLRKGTPLASRGAQGVSGPLLSCDILNLHLTGSELKQLTQNIFAAILQYLHCEFKKITLEFSRKICLRFKNLNGSLSLCVNNGLR